MSSTRLLEPTLQPDAVILGPAGGRAVPPLRSLPPSSQFCSINSGLCCGDHSHCKKKKKTTKKTKKKQDLSIFRLHVMSLVATMKAATGGSEERSVYLARAGAGAGFSLLYPKNGSLNIAGWAMLPPVGFPHSQKQSAGQGWLQQGTTRSWAE